jgi:hypothetical protein
MNLRSLTGREQLALTVEHTELRAIVHRGARILRWDTVPLPADTMKNQVVANAQSFAQAVDQLIDRLRAPRMRVTVGYHSSRAILRTLTLPPVPQKLLSDTVEREVRRSFPLPPHEIYLSWQPLESINGSGHSIFAVGVPRSAVDALMQGLGQAGIRPKALDLRPLALVRAVNRRSVVIVTMEQRSGSGIVLVEDFVPVMVRDITLPGQDLLSPVEQVPYLATEIQRVVDFHSSSRDGRRGASQGAGTAPWTAPELCLTGALAQDTEVVAELSTQWSVVAPDSSLSLPDGLPRATYLATLGLVLKKAGK